MKQPPRRRQIEGSDSIFASRMNRDNQECAMADDAAATMKEGRWADARNRWQSPVAQRVRAVLYWALIVVLAYFVYRRFAPSVELADLGPAPPIEMQTLDDQRFRLADLEGQVVVLNVWATWCPPCVVETPGFVGLQEEFDGQVQFVGLSTDDDLDDVHAFATKHAINYPLLVGRNYAGSGYHVPVLPTTYLIDREGRIRFRHEGLLLAHALRPALRALVRGG